MLIEFYSLLDFYPNRVKIRKRYEKLSAKEKMIYKKEVYSLCFEKEYVKDLIWEYMNNYMDSFQQLKKQYQQKKEKYDKNYR